MLYGSADGVCLLAVMDLNVFCVNI
jgi:hypothetical protein